MEDEELLTTEGDDAYHAESNGLFDRVNNNETVKKARNIKNNINENGVVGAAKNAAINKAINSNNNVISKAGNIVKDINENGVGGAVKNAALNRAANSKNPNINRAANIAKNVNDNGVGGAVKNAVLNKAANSNNVRLSKMANVAKDVNDSGVGGTAKNAALNRAANSKNAAVRNAANIAKISEENDGLANAAKNQVKKEVQKVADKAKDKAKQTAKVFIKKNAPVLIIPIIGFFLFLIILLLIQSGGAGGYVYLNCNYNEVVVHSTSCDRRVVINDDLSIGAYVKKIARIYIQDTDYPEEAIKALMIAIKTNVLGYGNYSFDPKEVNVDTCKFFPAGVDVNPNPEGEITTDLDALYAEVNEYLYVSQYYMYIITNLYDEDALELNFNKFNEFVRYARSGLTYEEILSKSYNFSNRGLYKLGNYCEIQSQSGEFWFPIGSLEPTEAGIYGGPLPVGTHLSSNWGYRPDPATNKTVFHYGIDILNGYKQLNIIIAPKDGEVIVADNICENGVTDYSCNNQSGNRVIIDHGDKIQTTFAHLSYNSITVSVGDKVRQGQMIGRMGNTGYSTGYHLHFAVTVDNVRVDPNDYVSLEYPRK